MNQHDHVVSDARETGYMLTPHLFVNADVPAADFLPQTREIMRDVDKIVALLGF